MSQHELDVMISGLAIGIEIITSVRNMATVLPLAGNKEDMTYIMEKMQKELDEGIAEIDHLIENNQRRMSI
jgi:hypothetical protein